MNESLENLKFQSFKTLINEPHESLIIRVRKQPIKSTELILESLQGSNHNSIQKKKDTKAHALTVFGP